MGLYRNTDGSVVEVDDAFAAARGMEPVSSDETALGLKASAIESRSDGVLGAINSGATAVLSGATLGLSDVALAGLATDAERERINQDRETHSTISTVGEIVGGIAPALANPASLIGRMPAGYLAHTANRAIGTVRAAGGVKAAVGTAAITGAEAAAQSAGSYLSDIALGDRELTAEGMAGALGRGFAFGSVAGGAMYGLEKGTIAARRMFARTAEGGEAVAKLAESTFTRKSEEIVGANDATLEVARARLKEIQAGKVIAQDAKAKAGADLAQAKLDKFNAPPIADDLPVAGLGDEVVPPVVDAPAPVAGVADDAIPPAAVVDDVPAPTAVADAPGASPLERQLQEMQGEISGGATLQDLNAKRVAPGHPLGKELAAEEARLVEAVTTYEARKQAVNEWVERARNPRIKRDLEGPGLNRGTRSQALADDVFVEQSGGGIFTIGKMESTLDDLTTNSRVLARSNGPDFHAGAKLDEAYDDAIEVARLTKNPEERIAMLEEAADIERQIHAYVRAHKPQNAAVIDRIEELRKQANTTGIEAAERRIQRAAERESKLAPGKRYGVDPEQEAAYQRTLAGGEDKGPRDLSWMDEFTADRMRRQGITQPSIVDDIDEATRVIGEYEKAAADLADVVGDAASPASKEARDALRTAEGEAERKMSDRAARAVDDAAEEAAKRPAPVDAPVEAPIPEAPMAGPDAGLAGPSPIARIRAAKTSRLEADATLGRLGVEERAVKAEIKTLGGGRKSKVKVKVEPEAAPAADAPDAAASRYGGIADMGAALEAANTLGIPGLPKPSDLPIIGPVLGMYLQFRALRAVAGRMTGRVPATGNARAAALAAKTKDKVAKAVDRLMGLAERAASPARTVSAVAGPRLVDILAKRIHDDGEPDAPEGANVQQLAAVRARELAAAQTNPGAVLAEMRRELRDILDPDLIKAAEDLQLRKIEHLNGKAPKGPEPTPFISRPWVPTLAQAAVFARRLQVADDPVAAIEAVERKCLTPEAADTLRAVYPKLFGQMQSRLLERSAELKATIPYQQRVSMSLLFDVPLDPSIEPATIALLQTAHTPAATTSPAAPTVNAPPVPSTAGPVDMTALYQPASDRRAARR